jgi:hypothetical protein
MDVQPLTIGAVSLALTRSPTTPPAPLPDWLTGLLTRSPAEAPAVECPPSAAAVGDLPAYARAALDSEAERVARSPEHGHNWALNKAAFNLGRLIGAGTLRRDLAEHVLQHAGQAAQPGEPPARIRIAAVIGAGIDAGTRQPVPVRRVRRDAGRQRPDRVYGPRRGPDNEVITARWSRSSRCCRRTSWTGSAGQAGSSCAWRSSPGSKGPTIAAEGSVDSAASRPSNTRKSTRLHLLPDPLSPRVN